MRVKFVRDFDWDVPGTNGRATIAYLGGHELSVTRACGAAAIAAGAAVAVGGAAESEPEHEVSDGGA